MTIRAAYILRPDVPIFLIHPSILMQPTVDGFISSGFYAREDVEQVVERFYGIHLLRWKAAFAGGKPMFVVFSWKGMVRFASTGNSASQFFAMRPFTPEERLAIMLELKRQMMKNPYFHLYFTPADSELTVDEISYYENYGVFMCKGETDFNLSDEHAEALITEPAFCEAFQFYYLNKLLKKEVVSDRSAMQMLDELIAMIRSQIRSSER